MSKQFKSFDEFWNFYVDEHSKPATKAFHFLGTTLGIVTAALSIYFGKWPFIPLGLVAVYSFAWFSHFKIERNKPATFNYPIRSLLADLKMWFLIATLQKVSKKTSS